MSPWKLLSIITVAGSLAISISGCSKELPQKTNAPIAKELPPKTKELISFKGIPLGKQGVLDALKQMCLENKGNNNEYSDKETCSFGKERNLIWLSYGILSDNLVWITLSNDGALAKVEIEGSKQAMLALADTLAAKYGKPVTTKSQIENGYGTKFEQDIFVWVDSQGARITVESIYSKVDKGRVVIESGDSVATKAAAERLLKEAAELNL